MYLQDKELLQETLVKSVIHMVMAHEAESVSPFANMIVIRLALAVVCGVELLMVFATVGTK